MSLVRLCITHCRYPALYLFLIQMTQTPAFLTISKPEILLRGLNSVCCYLYMHRCIASALCFTFTACSGLHCSAFSGTHYYYLLLGHPGTICFTADVFFLSFLQDLRAPSANYHETLPHNWKFAHLENVGPKIWELSAKNLWEGQKACRIWCDFGQLQTLIVNISRTDPDIDNPKNI